MLIQKQYNKLALPEIQNNKQQYFSLLKKRKKQFQIFHMELQKHSTFIFCFNIKMTQYNTLNIKLSNSQLNKLKYAIKNGTKITLNVSPNIVGDSNDENNFPHKLLLNNTQVLKFCKAFANNSSANIKLSKTQLHKIGLSRGFLGRLLGPLLRNGMPLIGNILKTLAKSV